MQDLPPGHLDRLFGPRPAGLADVDTGDLVSELMHRVRTAGAEEQATFPLERFHMLAQDLELAGNDRRNRFSRRRKSELFWLSQHVSFAGDPAIEGMTVLEVGCGSMNPLALSALFLMAGARRAFALDPEPPQDPSSALRAVAHLAAWMLADPRLVVDHYPITREQVAANLHGFDVGKLWYGDAEGLPDRLTHVRGVVDDIPLDDGSIDLSLSVSTLEHVDDLHAAIAELHRVTKPGGAGSHTIDGYDHRHYADTSIHPLDFLRVDTDEASVFGCNRVRPTAFPALFEQHGFEVLAFEPHDVVTVDEELRASFAARFRDLPADELGVLSAGIHVRKR